jgi:hypothetical protein
MPVRTDANVNISPLRDAVEPPQAVALLDKPLPFREAPEVIMANLSWARWVGVALGAFAMACGSSAAPISSDAELHLVAAPEDFKALGIGKEIEVREDGRRTPKSSDYFEWWYF